VELALESELEWKDEGLGLRLELEVLNKKDRDFDYYVALPTK
jgi:hypothetical protein